MNRRTMMAGLALAAIRPRPTLASDAPAAARLAIPVNPPKPVAGLKMTGIDGKAEALESHSGNLIVLNLWAPWCLPCREEMPSLSNLQARMAAQRVKVLPLAFDWRGVSGVEHFYRELGITNLPVLLGDGANLQSVLAMSGLPTTVILDTQLRHVATVTGQAVWDDDATMEWLKAAAAA